MTLHMLATLVTFAATVFFAEASGAQWPVTVGAKEVWDAAIDRATQTRFIPMELITNTSAEGAAVGIWKNDVVRHASRSKSSTMTTVVLRTVFDWRGATPTTTAETS
jgi:hypothetical protein